MSVSIFDPDFPDLPRGGSGPPRRCMGRRPDSKSDEFFVFTKQIVEI